MGGPGGGPKGAPQSPTATPPSLLPPRTSSVNKATCVRPILVLSVPSHPRRRARLSPWPAPSCPSRAPVAGLAEPCGLPENSSRAPGTRGRQGKQEVSSWAQGPGGCGVRGGSGRRREALPPHPSSPSLLSPAPETVLPLGGTFSAWNLPSRFSGPSQAFHPVHYADTLSVRCSVPTHSTGGEQDGRPQNPGDFFATSSRKPFSTVLSHLSRGRISLVPPLGGFRPVSLHPYPLFLGLSFPL